MAVAESWIRCFSECREGSQAGRDVGNSYSFITLEDGVDEGKGECGRVGLRSLKET